MIETTQNNALTHQNVQPNTQKKVLRMVKNERMGGYVPRWEAPQTGQQKIEQNLENAQEYKAGTTHSLAYSGTQTPEQQQDFSFGDLIDMVNPLHHVPIVGHIYRGVTGDEIKPIAQIIGGAVFGGPAGAASGLVNTVVQQETGRDVAGNAMALVTNQMQAPNFDDPETRLAAVSQNFDKGGIASDDLPGNLLSFVDLKNDSGVIIEKAEYAGGRTAGETIRTAYPDLDKNPLPAREPITQVRLSGLYALADN